MLHQSEFLQLVRPGKDFPVLVGGGDGFSREGINISGSIYKQNKRSTGESSDPDLRDGDKRRRFIPKRLHLRHERRREAALRRENRRSADVAEHRDYGSGDVPRRAGGSERHLRRRNQAPDEELDGVREQQSRNRVENNGIIGGFQNSDPQAAVGGGEI